MEINMSIHSTTYAKGRSTRRCEYQNLSCWASSGKPPSGGQTVPISMNRHRKYQERRLADSSPAPTTMARI
jgi:hypothetical protein